MVTHIEISLFSSLKLLKYKAPQQQLEAFSIQMPQFPRAHMADC